MDVRGTPEGESPGHAVRADMSGFVDRWFEAADGVRLHARDYAGAAGRAGRSVLCLHGLTRNARDFETLAPVIATTGRRVLAFDVRGRGLSGSSPDASAYEVGAYAEDVVGWMQALGIGRADLVGTSMGGLIAMTLALRAPALLGDVVLNDIGPEIAPAGLARILAYAGRDPGEGTVVADWAAAADYARAQNGASFPAYGPAEWDAFARRLFRETADGVALDYDPRIAEPIRAAAFAPDAGKPAAPTGGSAEGGLWPAFRALAGGDRRVTVVRGALSDILTSEISDRMRAAAPAIRVVEVPGVGHAPMLDEPEALAAVLALLARPSGRPPSGRSGG